MASEITPFFPPRRGRAHEVTGPGALTFAFALGSALGGTVLWISECWKREQINPTGFCAFLDPAKLLLARTKDQTDTLAVAEEALRSGAIALIVAETDQPLSLIAGRRLQLAAEAGKSTGLCIVPSGAGSNAAETRWHCAPLFDITDSTLQRWELIKNKTGTLMTWDVCWDAEARRISMASKTGQRPVFTRAPL